MVQHSVGQANVLPAFYPHSAARHQLRNEEIFIHVLRLIGMGIDERFQDDVKEVCTRAKGEHCAAPMKGYSRMKEKCMSRSDHYYCEAPRPSLNYDIIRNACTFDDTEDMIEFLHEMCSHKCFGRRPFRVKNMFMFDEERAESQYHYRAMMINWIYTPGITYADLALEASPHWDRYLEFQCSRKTGCKDKTVPWLQWREHIKQARANICGASAKNRQVQMIVETQLLLRPYLEGRKRMHFLYKILRSSDSMTLYKAFSTADTEKRSYAEVQKASRLEVTQFYESHAIIDAEAVATMMVRFAGQGLIDGLRAILERGADTNRPNAEGLTPLLSAARQGQSAAVSLLLRQGNIFVNGDASKRAPAPLYAASQNGHAEVVAILLKDAADLDVNERNAMGSTALHVACEQNNVEIVSLLANHPDIELDARRKGDLASPLYVAVCYGYSELVSVLTHHSAGCDVNLPSVDGTTPLGIALFHVGDSTVPTLQSQRKYSAVVNTMKRKAKLPPSGRNSVWAKNQPHNESEERERVVQMLEAHDARDGRKPGGFSRKCIVS